MESWPAPAPDTKDWTWTLRRRCEECGLAAGTVPAESLGTRLFVAAEEWAQILRSSPAVTARPAPAVWSPLEYGAHVRDLLGLTDHRLTRLLTEDGPIFENWDQDAAALEKRYAEEEPERVADQMDEEAERLADRTAGIAPDQWRRAGTRSDGSVFTVTTLLQYALHDVVHHLWDVTGQQDAAASLELA